MIHIELDKGEFNTSGTGSALLEEYQAITSRMAYYMKQSGMDKEWIADKLHKIDMLAIANAFPEIDETPVQKQILKDFFKKD